MVTYKSLKSEIVKAMKDKDIQRKEILRMLVSEIETKRVELKVADVNDLSESQVEGLIKSFLKGLRKEKEVFVNLNASTEKVDYQILVIEGLLPKELSEQETVVLVEKLIAELKAEGDEISMKSMGKLKAKLGATPVNMSIVSQTLKQSI